MQHSPEQWMEKAESDLTAARDLLRIETEALDAVCFHCQQAAEKFLKAVMSAGGMSIPRTHSMQRLLQLLEDVLPQDGKIRRDCAWLTLFAVDTRYPDRTTMAITVADARRALEIALAIKEICETKLKI